MRRGVYITPQPTAARKKKKETREEEGRGGRQGQEDGGGLRAGGAEVRSGPVRVRGRQARGRGHSKGVRACRTPGAGAGAVPYRRVSPLLCLCRWRRWASWPPLLLVFARSQHTKEIKCPKQGRTRLASSDNKIEPYQAQSDGNILCIPKSKPNQAHNRIQLSKRRINH